MDKNIMVTATRDIHIKSMGTSFLIAWKIKQFSTLGKEIQSDFFVLEDIKVQFVLFFVDNDPKSYIQTTFYRLTTDICPKIDFEIVNSQDKTKNVQVSQKAIFGSEKNRHNFSIPLSYDDIKNESNGFLCNSELTMNIQIFYKASVSPMISKLNHDEIKNQKRRLSSDFVISSSSRSQVKFVQLNSKDDSTALKNTNIAKNSKATTGYVGLQNQGATCYMNSMLESLYHTPSFRRLVFQIPTTGQEDETKSITLNLQRLFCRLQISEHACPTTALTRSFGWTSQETFMQHDVQEFCRVLMNNLEEKLKNTKLSNGIADLFRGEFRNYIRCVNVNYESSRNEFFYDLSLAIKGCENLEKSFNLYVAKERLDGNNQYSAGEYGKQDADMGTEFLQLPKVLHLHLRRFDFDYSTLRMEKVNDKFEFPKEIDLTQFVVNPGDRPFEPNLYLYDLYGILVHSGGVYGGHYYAFLRTTTDKQWFKFNDSCVTKEEEETAIDDNFGGNGKLYSAYMLVYVSRKFADEIFKPVSDDEIPQHLKDYVAKAEVQEKIEKEELQRKANTIYVSSLSEDVIETNALAGRFGFKPIVEDEKLELQKSTTVDELYQKLAERYNKKVSQIRLWETNFNRNPVRFVKLSKETNLAEINTTSTQMLDFFVQFKDEDEPLEIEENKIMVYLKFFFPKEKAPFQYLGHFVVAKEETLKNELFSKVCDCLGCPNFAVDAEQSPKIEQKKAEEEVINKTDDQENDASGMPAPPPPPPPPPPPLPGIPGAVGADSEKMFVYQELLNSKTKKLNVNETFTAQGIGNGAILVFQVAPGVTDVPEFKKIQIKEPIDANLIINEKKKENENGKEKEASNNISEKAKTLSQLLNQEEKVNENDKKEEDDDVRKVDFMKYSEDFNFNTVDNYINIFSNVTDIDIYDLEKADKPLFRLHISTFLPFDQIKHIIANEANLDYDPSRDSIILYKGTSPDKLPTSPMDLKMYSNPRSYFLSSPSLFKMKYHRLYFHMNHKMSEEVAANSSQFTVQFSSDGYNVDYEKKVISEKKSACITIFEKAESKNYNVQDLRFMSIYDHKIYSFLNPEQEFTWSYYILRVDVVPEEQKIVADGDFILPVAHGYTDSAFYTHSKGNPFLIKVIKDELFSETKKRILKCIKYDSEKLGDFEGQFKLNADTKALGKEAIVKDDDMLSNIATANSILYIISKEDMNVRSYNVGSRMPAQSLKIYN